MYKLMAMDEKIISIDRVKAWTLLDGTTKIIDFALCIVLFQQSPAYLVTSLLPLSMVKIAPEFNQPY